MVKRAIHRISPSGLISEYDDLAEEVIISIYNGDETVVRILASPIDLKELAIGHIACEGRGNVSSISVEANSLYLDGKITKRPKEDLLTAACGACSEGDISIPDIIVTNNVRLIVKPSELIDSMNKDQIRFEKTGGVHASGLFSPDGVMLSLKEDIGRHNTVDKVVGAAIMKNENPSEYILVLSGRMGWELVAKAARVGIEIVVSVGAISSAAADLGRACGMTLIGFARENSGVVIGDTNRIGW